MINDSVDQVEPIPLGVLQEIDRLCERFEREWANDLSPTIEAYVASAPPACHEGLLRELVGLDLEHRRARGDLPTIHDYTVRFPEHTEIVRSVWNTHRVGVATHKVQVRAGANDASLSPPPDEPRGFGDYLLLRKLGKGGMGVVYAAQQISLNRTVALKLIRGGEFADDDELRRFQNEAEAAAQLDHPGIVPVLEVGEFGGQRYYTMKLIAGGSLSERLDHYRDDPRIAARLVLEVAEAIHHAHQRGVLHRDIKPGNVLIDSEGRAHVADFGLAKVAGRNMGATRSGGIVGSPSYMAPEQAAGNRAAISTATDVYGIGSVLYALLAGRPPFSGDSILETLDLVRDCPPEPAKKFNPNVPHDLEVICRKCLEKEPRHRYSSAQALGDDLKRWLAGEPITARPVSSLTRGWMWCRRNPTLAALGAGLMAALVLGIAGISTEWRRAERNLALANRANADLIAANANLRQTQSTLRRTLYTSTMNLVQTSWETNRPGQVRDLLTRVTPATGETDLRGYEWYYWDRLSHAELLTFTGAQNDISSVAYSPDGRKIASGGKFGVVKVWDANSGKELIAFQAHSAATRSVVFSPDGRRLATASLDHQLCIWDAETGKLALPITGHTDVVTCAAFSPDGRRLASSSWDKTVRIWDAATGRAIRVLSGHTLRVRTVAYSPDGRRLVSGGFDNQVKLWDAETGKCLQTFTGHTDVVSAVAFSPDGNRIASSSIDRTVRVWDARAKAPPLILRGHSNWAHGVAFSPDGRRIVSAGWDATLKLWDAANGDEVVTLKGHASSVTSVVFRPDGKRIASASEDGTIKVWDPVPDSERVILRGHTEKVRDVAFSGDGKFLASAGDDGHAFVWNPASGELAGPPILCPTRFLAVGLSPDGRIALDDTHSIEIRDVATGTLLLTLGDSTGSVRDVAFSRDGQWIASGGEDRSIKVWNSRTGDLRLVLSGHDDPINSVAFNADTTQIVSADDGGHIKVWDTATGRVVQGLTYLAAEPDVNSVTFSPSGQEIAAAGRDRLAHVWNVRNGREIAVLKGHTSVVYDLAFSPDGRRIATAARDHTIKVWDAETGSELLTLSGHSAPVLAVAFSPDGRRIASAGGDRTVRIWDAGPDLPRPASPSNSGSASPLPRVESTASARAIDPEDY